MWYVEGSGLRIILRWGDIQEGGKIGQERCCLFVQEWDRAEKGTTVLASRADLLRNNAIAWFSFIGEFRSSTWTNSGVLCVS